MTTLSSARVRGIFCKIQSLERNTLDWCPVCAAMTKVEFTLKMQICYQNCIQSIPKTGRKTTDNSVTSFDKICVYYLTVSQDASVLTERYFSMLLTYTCRCKINDVDMQHDYYKICNKSMLTCDLLMSTGNIIWTHITCTWYMYKYVACKHNSVACWHKLVACYDNYAANWHGLSCM